MQDTKKAADAKYSSTIKMLLEEEGAAIRKAHFDGAGGSEVVERRTALVDRVLRDAYNHVAGSGAMPALVAVGGYGRGELNPYSDVDIMFLCRDDSDRQRSPELLYLLWDAGLEVGYSGRTIQECVTLAKKDSKIRTSLLESRLIAGDASLYGSFLNTMQSEVFYWKTASYIAEKIAERTTLRRQYGGSMYLREPNIKECEGGLRDFHAAIWIACSHFRISALQELVARRVITAEQYVAFVRARNFLWKVRNEIHYLSGRRNDQLTFDLQEQAAQDFKYRNSTHLLAVERFMKCYFLHARTIREFSNRIMEVVLKKHPSRLFERVQSLERFNLVGRVLFPASDDISRTDLSFVMSAFEIAQSRHAVFSDRLKVLISRCMVNDALRKSSDVSRSFLAILNNPEGLFETLFLMKELRVLGKYIPEFRAIQALAKHDYYHRYTVDEHILFAIKTLDDLWAGKYPSLKTLFDIYRGLPKRWILNLAVLLHDLGKVFRSDHEYKGVDLAARVLERLGIEGEDRERILFLIKNHLVMTTLSQRRELTDVKVIENFATCVQNTENLALLYLLTFADISAVNPTSWTQWKAAQLQELYLRTLSHLQPRGEMASYEEGEFAIASEKIRNTAAKLHSSNEIEDFLTSMSAQYVLHTETIKAIDDIGMMKRLPDEELVIQHRHYPDRGYTELTVCAYDAYGMFYRTAGTIASKNLNILRAQVHTSKKGVMIDTFLITDPEGRLYNYEPEWQRVITDLKTALMSKTAPPAPRRYATKKSLPGVIPTTVEFDNTTSDLFTIVDITARDRVGFLYYVTRALYDLNLDIGSATIVTEGARAMDSFYVTDMMRKKILDEKRLEKIKETLLQVIKE
ncbi:MAG: [protein-PII] uridylyltransferase [Nitrospirota bacterium]